MPYSCPRMREGGLHYKCDAMLARTLHYSYTSTAHVLYSSGKNTTIFLYTMYFKKIFLNSTLLIQQK